MEIINVNTPLKYPAILYPYNWDPTSLGGTIPTFSTGCRPTLPCPHYRTRFGNQIIYGGWGNDSIHGVRGSDAISRAEATVLSFTNNYNMDDSAVKLNAGVLESDWYHPFNPGNVLGWNVGLLVHGNAARAGLQGKFSLFDPTDPRRKVMLNGDGTLCKLAPMNTACLPWILDFDPTEGPLDNKWNPGTAYASIPTHVSGDDAIFGDLGNSWIVTGPSRSRAYGGWGEDHVDLRRTPRDNCGPHDAAPPNPAPHCRHIP